jgi:hypothetical protein
VLDGYVVKSDGVVCRLDKGTVEGCAKVGGL